MIITTRIKNATLIVKMTGELDHHSAGPIREAVDRIIMSGGVKNILFDMSSLSMMDSSGIGMVIGRYKLISADGGKVSIFAKTKTILKILKMSGIERIAPVYEAIEKAEEYLDA